jgi:hypothetical protein
VGAIQVSASSQALWTRYEPAQDLPLPEAELPSRNFTGYGWPVAGTDIDGHLVRDVRRFARSMLWFLSDRHDLGRMLIHRTDSGLASIRRGDVVGTAWGEYSARIAAAVILARIDEDRDLEAAALARVTSGVVSARAVGRWAAQDQAWSPVDISDLQQLGR